MSVISDADVERILRGGHPEDPALAPLTSSITALAEFRNLVPPPETRERHVSMAADIAREAPVPPPNRRPAARAASWRLLPRFGVSLAALALVVGMTGVAVASDAAIPGDPLHGIDLALEKIGVGAGGAAERISEAREMAIGGMPVEALDYVSSAIEAEQGEASKALKDAAERLKAENAGDASVQAHSPEVAAMLEWMATTDMEGEDFGLGVAEWAKKLGIDEPGPDSANGPDAGEGNGRGNSEDRGRSQDNGNGP